MHMLGHEHIRKQQEVVPLARSRHTIRQQHPKSIVHQQRPAIEARKRQLVKMTRHVEVLHGLPMTRFDLGHGCNCTNRESLAFGVLSGATGGLSTSATPSTPSTLLPVSAGSSNEKV
jgi:hypothetical protein